MKDLTRSDINYIVKEFIRYDNLYCLAGKKIKFDFILSIILNNLGKAEIAKKIKKF